MINLQIIFTIIIIYILKSKDLFIKCKRQNYSSNIDYNKKYENNNTEKVPEKPYYEEKNSKSDSHNVDDDDFLE